MNETPTQFRPEWANIFNYETLPPEYSKEARLFIKYWQANYNTYNAIFLINRESLYARPYAGADQFIKEMGHQSVNLFLRTVALVSDTKSATYGEAAFESLTQQSEKTIDNLKQLLGMDTFRHLWGLTNFLEGNAKIMYPATMFEVYSVSAESFLSLYQSTGKLGNNSILAEKPVTLQFEKFKIQLTPLELLESATHHEIRHGGILSAEMSGMGFGRSVDDINLWG